MIDWLFVLLLIGSIAIIFIGWSSKNPFIYMAGVIILLFVGIDLTSVGIERISGVVETPLSDGGTQITYIFTPMNGATDFATMFLTYFIWGMVLIGLVGMFALLWS